MIGVAGDESLVCELHSFPSAPVWAVPGVVDCLAPQESLLWAVAQHFLHLPLASDLAEVGDGSSVSRADVSSGANLESMEVALEALLTDVGGQGSISLTFSLSGSLNPLNSVEWDGEFHQVDFGLCLPLVQDHKIRPLGSHDNFRRDGTSSHFPALEVGVEGQAFQPGGSESFEQVMKDLVMSIGESALVWRIGGRGCRETGCKVCTWGQQFPPTLPSCQVLQGCWWPPCRQMTWHLLELGR